MLTTRLTQEALMNIVKINYIVKNMYNKCLLLEVQLFNV